MAFRQIKTPALANLAVTNVKLDVTSITGQTALGTISSKTDDVIMIFDSANSALKKISITDLITTSLTTGDLPEGSNQYFTEERAKSCLTGGLCITYSSVTGEIKVDESEAESSLRVAESVSSDDADKLDGQEGTYYRINVYNVAGTLVN